LTPAFDRVAADFERHRGLPDVATGQLRDAVRKVLGPNPGALLDLGAGTGRLGRPFVRAKDGYVGVDRSLPMLERFRAATSPSPERSPGLALAEGASLPFPAGSFRGVLLAHVLSGSPDWKAVLAEARRVLDSAGVLFLAQRTGPPDGLDARLRAQLRKILASLEVPVPEAGGVRDEARAWLAGVATSHEQVVAARWTVEATPSDFMTRHSTGARFASLPAAVQRESMARLADWAVATFGGLETSVAEDHRLELDAFRLSGSARRPEAAANG
jgi:ubiquinone/menaquinone biosynthesis C-methylase UbiE